MITQILNIFRRNLLQKLIALIMAFCMWIYVMDAQDPEINDYYVIPLTISNAPYEFIPLFDDKNINIEVRAPRSYFAKYDSNAFRIFANLEGLGEGEHKITPQIIMPQGFELINVFPETVIVKLDPLVEQQMPIEITTSGALNQDSVIKEMEKSMDVVTVVGPKTFVEQVNKIVGNVNLANNTSNFEVQIPMQAIDNKGTSISRVRVVPSVITVSVNVESGAKKRIVPVVPELNVADGWELTKINVEPAQVEISGAESVINSIVTIKTTPVTVQTSQRMFKSNLKLVVPEGVTVKSDSVAVSAEVVRNLVVNDQTP